MGFGAQINKVADPAGFRFAGSSVGDVLTVVLNYVFTFAGLALLIYFLSGGFKLFTSGGDQKKVAEGKQTITNALIGFIIIFAAFWIVRLSGLVLNLPGITGLFK